MNWLKGLFSKGSEGRRSGMILESGPIPTMGRSARWTDRPMDPIEINLDPNAANLQPEPARTPTASGAYPAVGKTQPMPIQSPSSRTQPMPLQPPTRTEPVLGTILLVDADPARRERLAAYLESKQFGVVRTQSVDEAITYHGPLNFAFVSLDLPDRPGWQIWNRLCTDNREPQVLFWSQSAETWERMSFRHNDRVMFLQWPFTADQLMGAMLELERRRRF